MRSQRDKARSSRSLLMGVTLGVVTVGAACDGTAGNDSEAGGCGFFDGETVELVVPADPGGGFDVYGRLIAPELEEELGATVIVRNQPGGGGLTATNRLWETEPDGLTIELAPTTGLLASELGQAPGVAFTTSEFSWIGRVVAEPDVLVVAADSAITSVDDLQDASDASPVRFGSYGPGEQDYTEALIFENLVDVPIEVISGYGNAPEIIASMVRGELDAYWISLGSAAPLIESGEVRAVAIFGEPPTEGLDDVPTMLSIAGDDPRAAEIIETHGALLESGRALIAPPGMDGDRLQCLRDAFERVATDEEFVSNAEEQGRPITYLGGDELQAVVESAAVDPSADYLELTRASYQAGG